MEAAFISGAADVIYGMISRAVLKKPSLRLLTEATRAMSVVAMQRACFRHCAAGKGKRGYDKMHQLFRIKRGRDFVPTPDSYNRTMKKRQKPQHCGH